MTILIQKDYEKLLKQMKEDLHFPVSLVPTPKLHIAEKEIFTEANEYDVEKIKRKLDMFLKTNDLQYLGKVLYLVKELIKDNT